MNNYKRKDIIMIVKTETNEINVHYEFICYYKRK